jgi:hypothetical protein
MHILIGGRLRQQRDNSYYALQNGQARVVAISVRKPG